MPSTRTRRRVLTGGAILTLLAAACVSVIHLGVTADEAQATERVARVGPEIPLTDTTYVTTLPGFADLLIGCHDGLRIVVSADGSRTGASVAAVLDPTGCPQ